MPTDTVWRGTTLGERTQERRSKFIDAGYRLLGTKGAAETTMRAICREAGLSQKYFYETFDNRDELVIAVHDRVVEELNQLVADVPDSGSVEHRVRSAFQAAADYFEDDPRRVRIAFRESFADDALRDHASRTVPVLVLAAIQNLAAADDGVSFEGRQDVPLLISSLSGALVTVYLNWLEQRIAATKPEVVEHCTALVLAILRL